MTTTELDLRSVPQLPYEERVSFTLDMRHPRNGEIVKMLSYLVQTSGGAPIDIKLTRNLTLRNVVGVTSLTTSDINFSSASDCSMKVDLTALCLDVIDITPVDVGLLTPSVIG